MSKSLKEELSRSAPWLLDSKRFQVIEDTYSSAHFGNSTLVLQSTGLLIKFNRDRGYTEGYVASLADGEWWRIESVLEVVQNTVLSPLEPTLAVGVQTLQQHFSLIANAMGPGYAETLSELTRRGPERLERSQKWAREQLEKIKQREQSTR